MAPSSGVPHQNFLLPPSTLYPFGRDANTPLSSDANKSLGSNANTPLSSNANKPLSSNANTSFSNSASYFGSNASSLPASATTLACSMSSVLKTQILKFVLNSVPSAEKLHTLSTQHCLPSCSGNNFFSSQTLLYLSLVSHTCSAFCEIEYGDALSSNLVIPSTLPSYFGFTKYDNIGVDSDPSNSPIVSCPSVQSCDPNTIMLDPN